MLTLVKRNLKLYFNNRTTVFFSMVAALISFILYPFFLKNDIQQSWQKIPETTKLLDPWLIGGTLSTTAITTVLIVLRQLVKDREDHTMADLYLTDASSFSIQASYLISAMLIGTIMQLFVFVVMTIIFSLSDHMDANWQLLPVVILIALLSSLIWTTFYMIFFNLIRKSSSLIGINSILGTLSGFFTLVYIPLNIFPRLGRDIIQFTPAPYVSSLYRELLMHPQLQRSFKNLPAHLLVSFKNDMGINLNFATHAQQTLMILLIFLIVFILLDIISFVIYHHLSKINY